MHFTTKNFDSFSESLKRFFGKNSMFCNNRLSQMRTVQICTKTFLKITLCAKVVTMIVKKKEIKKISLNN